jgi:cyclase
MLTRRVIACLDVRHGEVTKGVNFANLRTAGDPAALAERYDRNGADEIVLLDVSATLEGRRALAATVEAVAERVFVPLTIGGGIRDVDDARALFDAGADKVSVNSAALAEPALISAIAGLYGSQAVVVAIDAAARGDTYEVRSRGGTRREPRDAVDWAREAVSRGAGEILLTSIDRDGTRAGFDCFLTRAVSRAVTVPVIASGGAGTPEHFVDVFRDGLADAALAASILHFEHCDIRSLKRYLANSGVTIRVDDGADSFN